MKRVRKDCARSRDPEAPGISGSRASTASTAGTSASFGMGDSTSLWGAVRIIIPRTFRSSSSMIHHDIVS